LSILTAINWIVS